VVEILVLVVVNITKIEVPSLVIIETQITCEEILIIHRQGVEVRLTLVLNVILEPLMMHTLVIHQLNE